MKLPDTAAGSSVRADFRDALVSAPAARMVAANDHRHQQEGQHGLDEKCLALADPGSRQRQAVEAIVKRPHPEVEWAADQTVSDLRHEIGPHPFER